MKYNYKTLNNIYDENFEKVKSGVILSNYDIELTKAAGYALDFYNHARLGKIKLHFTCLNDQEIEKTGHTLLITYMNIAKKNNYDENLSRNELWKKFASYMFFVVANDFEGSEEDDWELQPAIIKNGTLGFKGIDRYGNILGEVDLFKGIRRMILTEMLTSGELDLGGNTNIKNTPTVSFEFAHVFQYISKQIRTIQDRTYA